jgi:hypothetical protein
MEGDASVSGGIFWAFRFASELAFRWIPGTVQTIAGTAAQNGTSPVLSPITDPMTTADVARFLQAASAPGAYEQLVHQWSVFVALSAVATLLLGVGVAYCVIRIFQVRRNEAERFAAVAHPIASKDVSKAQLRWNNILEESRSENGQSWRLAILEADILLNELLDVLGYRGETMADKMKQANRNQFTTIDLAWEAHLVRNAIAHQGSMQELTAREARRVIGLYERVFKEFQFIS